MDNIHEYYEDTCIKRLVPGIINERERQEMSSLDKHKSELKNEELYYRVQQK